MKLGFKMAMTELRHRSKCWHSYFVGLLQTNDSEGWVCADGYDWFGIGLVEGYTILVLLMDDLVR